MGIQRAAVTGPSHRRDRRARQSPPVNPGRDRAPPRKLLDSPCLSLGRPQFSNMGLLASAPRILAVLGPTNTGKTHLAIERMLGHQTGMIGFPLRLLARENYDRVVRIKGARAVALITGEEKIVPANPSYFVWHAESWPPA